MMKTPAYIAAHIRRVLLNGASAPHTEEVQHFFKEEIKSRGGYTGELRKGAACFRKATLTEWEQNVLIAVAAKIFSGRILEEKVFAVFPLHEMTKKFTHPE